MPFRGLWGFLPSNLIKMLSESFTEDLVANMILGIALVGVACMRDFCKRVSHSDCVLDKERGLAIKLPTWRSRDDEEQDV